MIKYISWRYDYAGAIFCSVAASIGARHLPIYQSKIMRIYIDLFDASPGRGIVTNASQEILITKI